MVTGISGIVPAVNDFPQLRQFLKTEYPLCVVMHTHIADLDNIFSALRDAGKTALVHCDLIRGLAPDEYGAEYLARRLKPAGIISIRPTVIAACKKMKLTAIQRAFLIDSSALEKSLASITKSSPDYVEVLPALCTELFPELSRKLGLPLIAGGLIPSRAAANEILNKSVCAVTVSMRTLQKDLE